MYDEGTLQALAGGLKVKVHVQHPKILEAKFREGWMWFFRYYADDVQANGSVKTTRKKQAVGPSRGDNRITKKQAEVERDKFLAKLNAPTVEQVAATGVVLFNEVAKMYGEGYLGREMQIAKPTRLKEQFYLDKYIVPKRGALRLNQIRPQPGKPLWDSGIRHALHQAAEEEGCDFRGLGPHSFRRANITWRQQVGGSAIEASKIAGHSDLAMTGEYTFVTPERQNELTRRIQQKLADAGTKQNEKVPVTIIPSPAPPTPEAPPSLADTVPVTSVVQ